MFKDQQWSDWYSGATGRGTRARPARHGGAGLGQHADWLSVVPIICYQLTYAATMPLSIYVMQMSVNLVSILYFFDCHQMFLRECTKCCQSRTTSHVLSLWQRNAPCYESMYGNVLHFCRQFVCPLFPSFPHRIGQNFRGHGFVHGFVNFEKGGPIPIHVGSYIVNPCNFLPSRIQNMKINVKSMSEYL